MLDSTVRKEGLSKRCTLGSVPELRPTNLTPPPSAIHLSPHRPKPRHNLTQSGSFFGSAWVRSALMLAWVGSGQGRGYGGLRWGIRKAWPWLGRPVVRSADESWARLGGSRPCCSDSVRWVPMPTPGASCSCQKAENCQQTRPPTKAPDPRFRLLTPPRQGQCSTSLSCCFHNRD